MLLLVNVGSCVFKAMGWHPNSHLLVLLFQLELGLSRHLFQFLNSILGFFQFIIQVIYIIFALFILHELSIKILLFLLQNFIHFFEFQSQHLTILVFGLHTLLDVFQALFGKFLLLGCERLIISFGELIFK